MRYFIIPFNDPNLQLITCVIFGELSSQRKSIDKKLFVASLCEGDASDYEFLKHLKEYDVKEILQLLNSTNWTNQIGI